MKPVVLWTALLALPLTMASLSTHAAIVSTGDGLQVSFSDADGSITGVAVDGVEVPLLSGVWGGFTLAVNEPILPGNLVSLDFDSTDGSWTAARNSNWDNAGLYATLVADGGVGDSGHLLLGDGATTGVGMAMANPVAVENGSNLRISWQAKSASVDTTQILCVRVFDSEGVDITEESVRPAGWNWSSTSQAHYVTGITNEQADVWENFAYDYLLPEGVCAVQVSLRHWTGGDHLVHVDDLRVDVRGGIRWREAVPVAGPITATTNGFTQLVDVPGQDVRVVVAVTGSADRLNVDAVLQDTTSPMTDRAIIFCWTLPIDVEGWLWWDDIDKSHEIVAGDAAMRNTWAHGRHQLSRYPYCSVTDERFGIGQSFRMDDPVVGYFDCQAEAGLRLVREMALSPVTVKLGAGRASTSMQIFSHDPKWGFRAATKKYHGMFPELFVKRTRREGAWMYPIHASQIPNPMDFGFAFHETWPMDDAELDLCESLDIGVFYYVEPWLAWCNWSNEPERPSQEERVERLESWVDGVTLATWIPNGGVMDSGHLLLGNGMDTGAGMATSNAFAVVGGDTAVISWLSKVASLETGQILCVRVYDESGEDITEGCPSPTGWGWSPTSQAHYVTGLTNTTTNGWEAFSRQYEVPTEAASMRVSVRYWNGGYPYVHMDNLAVTSLDTGSAYLTMTFDGNVGGWNGAQHAGWENPQPSWLRVERRQAAQAILDASPLDADGKYFIDYSYLWHEWSTGTWAQAWPVNSDPDLPSPNVFDIYREQWVLRDLGKTDGIYIDSVSGFTAVAGWENRREDHMVYADSPLTFSWKDGGAAQIVPQAQVEFLNASADELWGMGKLMMLNLFPAVVRFHVHNGDITGSEVSDLVESEEESRLRRTLASKKIVTNLLQFNWDGDYITYNEMEEFIRGQMFWGFYPAVSSGGGPMDGGTPDRYFLHPELYERDRPLFQRYMPVVQMLSSSGWEPVTGANVSSNGEIERFGNLGDGSLYFTVRDEDGAAGNLIVTVDLDECGMPAGVWPVEVYDVLSDSHLSGERLYYPRRLRFAVSLEAGEVGVYRLTKGPYPTGDYDEDGVVDLDDLGQMLFCTMGPGVSYNSGNTCLVADTDDDADVDLLDLSRILPIFAD